MFKNIKKKVRELIYGKDVIELEKRTSKIHKQTELAVKDCETLHKEFEAIKASAYLVKMRNTNTGEIVVCDMSKREEFNKFMMDDQPYEMVWD